MATHPNEYLETGVRPVSPLVRGMDWSAIETAHFEHARQLIRPFIQETPCVRSDGLSNALRSDIFLKLENLQTTGSFKIRGVTHKLLSLTAHEKQTELIAASTGNHGAAFLYMLQKLGLKGRLFVPKTIADTKWKALKAFSTPLEKIGCDCVETEHHAAELARQGLGTLVPPYNDPHVVVGQGTAAVEMADQVNAMDVVFVPVGGGGLVSGIATYLKKASPATRVIGCLPERSPVMYESVRAGRIVPWDGRNTCSDATAGGIEDASITFDLCRAYVDDYVLLTETEIHEAMRELWQMEQMIVEAGAALAVAAVRKMQSQFQGKRIALVISGSKADPRLLERIGIPYD